MLLLVAMGSATAYESTHGTERARSDFYCTWWFELLLALLGLNVLASLLVRLPFRRRQVGFVVTHVSILLILGGAWITKKWGIDGQVSIGEGQTVSGFRVPQECLTVSRSDDRSVASLDLISRAIRSRRPVDLPASSVLSLEGLQLTAEHYLPDSERHDKVVNDNPKERVAVEVGLAMGAGKLMSKSDSEPEEMKQWVLADTPEEAGGSSVVKIQIVETSEELKTRLARAPASRPSSKGSIHLDIQGKHYSLTVEECMSQPAPVGDTGYLVRVLRYLPHAIVGQDHQLTSASSQPVNPAIEAEITGPKGTIKQLAFARFPDFQAMHGGEQQDVRVRFTAASEPEANVPIEIITSRSGELGARFTPEDGSPATTMITQGQAVETPWPGVRLTVHERYDHARRKQEVVPVSPPREGAIPALRLTARTSEATEQFWLRKGESRMLSAGGMTHRVTFDDKVLPLGFDLTLERFRIGYYPGTQRPRSFESQITISDPSIGRQQTQVVSMNRPVSHGDYTLFQSSYHQQASGKSTSVLSVSWDPGKPVVFAGYLLMFGGMLWMLVMRRVANGRPNNGTNPSISSEGSGNP